MAPNARSRAGLGIGPPVVGSARAGAALGPEVFACSAARTCAVVVGPVVGALGPGPAVVGAAVVGAAVVGAAVVGAAVVGAA
jgi:hypothetical protein